MEQNVYNVGIYARLSRDDGDKIDSDSIVNQLRMLQDFCERFDDMVIADQYVDDGYTGTNFNRPDFQRLLTDVEAGRINCVVVKDLSRFGRDYIDTGEYLERYFPARNVRFVAINDNIDSNRGAYDMMLPVKNIFNAQYAKDISAKVKSAFDTKRKQGQFIGAFCSYGYAKDPAMRNRLVIDPAAAKIVQRVYALFESGMGKDSIAKLLNDESIPCPSEYKRLMGASYYNGKKLTSTTYWTYSTIDRMLANQIYAGDMVQAKHVRATMHGKPKKQAADQWIVVEGTHEAIIPKAQWNRVQALRGCTTRAVDFSTKDNPLSGLLKCGDCGRGMVHRRYKDKEYYACGSYERYGPSACSKHRIEKQRIEEIILDDLNRVVAQISDLRALLTSASAEVVQAQGLREKDRLQKALERILKLRKGIYEDYKDGIISKEEYVDYRADYDNKEKQLRAQMAQLDDVAQQGGFLEATWAKELLVRGCLTTLDRIVIAETIQSILVFADGRIEISYRFAEELSALFADGKAGEA